MTVAIYGRSIEPEFFPYLKRLVEGLERKGVGMVCEEKFAALLSGNYGYEPKFLNCFGRCTLIKEEVELLLSVGGDGTFLDSVIYVKDSGVPVLGVNSGHLGFLANVPVEEIEDAVDFIVRLSSDTYESLLYQMSVKQRDVFLAIASEKSAREVTGSRFIKKYGLVSPSSVSSAVKSLLDKDFITNDKGTYSVYDKFFLLWLSRQNLLVP